MSLCSCKCNCTAAAVIVSVIVGVLAAFLQITGVITVTPVFLWVVFGIAVGYLAVFILGPSLYGRGEPGICTCIALNAVLVGILGTILFALVLLAVGIVATSVVSAILVGVTLFFFALIISATACYVRSISGCVN